MTRNRRTDEEIAQSVDHAKRLRDVGLPPAVVALKLQRAYGLTRSTAWRDVQAANEERGAEGLAASPQATELRDSMVNLLMQALVDAAEDGEAKALPRISKEIRELLAMGGTNLGAPVPDSQAGVIRAAFATGSNDVGTR